MGFFETFFLNEISKREESNFNNEEKVITNNYNVNEQIITNDYSNNVDTNEYGNSGVSVYIQEYGYSGYSNYTPYNAGYDYGKELFKGNSIEYLQGLLDGIKDSKKEVSKLNIENEENN